jgi:hypothetical protein
LDLYSDARVGHSLWKFASIFAGHSIKPASVALKPLDDGLIQLVKMMIVVARQDLPRRETA